MIRGWIKLHSEKKEMIRGLIKLHSEKKEMIRGWIKLHSEKHQNFMPFTAQAREIFLD
jgi:hypothetical protein